MSAPNTSPLPPLSPAGQTAREEAKRIAKSQPVTKVGGREKEGTHDGWRDTIESIVIAFIFAFLFRTFVAEAFIIPTGSMAETLYGRHKDVHCPQCNTRFRVGASEEVDRDNGYFRPEGRVKYGFCPNCRYQMDIEDELPFAGDRILVNKFPYEFGNPQRWDVVVFKFPEDPKTSYIKRLIGLPGEAISIMLGDLFRQEGELGKSEILRKPPDVQRDTQIPVYNNDHPAKVLLDQGFPERWAAVVPANPETLDPDSWKADPATRSFAIDATQKPGVEAWLRYRHYIPQPIDWQNAFAGKRIETAPHPMLVTDHYSYNSGYTENSRIADPEIDSVGEKAHWVGDLTLDCELEVLASQGVVTLELIEGQRKYHCDFDLASGRSTLSYQDASFRRAPDGTLEDIAVGDAQTAVGKPGKYRLSFANVDDRLLLSINGKWVKFQHQGEATDGTYEFPQQVSERLPVAQDLSPAGIAVKDANVRVSHLVLQRDTYYTNYSSRLDPTPHNVRQLLEAPDQYAQFVRQAIESAARSHYDRDRYVLSADEFLVLGDNSPRSADSRAWVQRPYHAYAVNRRQLIGKAFMIYWPHGMPFPNGRGYTPDLSLGKGGSGKWPYFWHFVQRRDDNGRLFDEPTDYPANAIPFLPQAMPWMSKEGRWFKWIR